MIRLSKLVLALAFVFSLSFRDSPSRIELIGSEEFIQKTNLAMNYLRQNDEDSYEEFIRGFKSMREAKCTRFVVPDSMEVSSGTYNSDRQWYASVLLHESNHERLYSRGAVYYGLESERAGLEKQDRFLRRIGSSGIDIDGIMRTEWWKTDCR